MQSEDSGEAGFSNNWKDCLPLDDFGDVRDVSDQAVWTLSTCKPGYGVEQLLDDNAETYWQSDGPQPHLVTVHFQRKTPVAFLGVYVNYRADESYTPSKISVRVGSHPNDLKEVSVEELNEPSGWQIVDLRANSGNKSIRTFVVQLAVLQNHQNGRDTHIRQLKVFAPSVSPIDQFQQPLITARNPMLLPQQFSTVEMNQFSVLR